MNLTRSQLAKESNINTETIRYYLKRGLVAEPPRTESGYRLFPTETVKRISFIKRSQELGFTLEEIKELLTISDHRSCHDAKEVKEITDNKIEQIEKKIKDLQRMKDALELLSIECPGKGFSVDECSIIKSLAGE
ncbi:MerR family DNA-binding protein [Desertibacillus haloalkaliphilus]|uniref:MerR family DNA-binding protein n=1 Tax=Desertibacillus haloalkaliphilus TaxID=1328930 RepID=UPI001C252F09|nr:MerR family DNA-binding protein [Desertibacillus haloalkaliphilus]MBU8908022.1 MerR family DNA-binding protein [Desertibacillus haloalkaliphilus]